MLIELNIAKEESKSGLYLEQVDVFLDQIADFDRIRLKGFMTVAPYTDDRYVFAEDFRTGKSVV